jgi:DUF917 family protein
MTPLHATQLRHYIRGADVLARGSGSATPFMDAVLRGERAAPALIRSDELRGHMATVVKFGATGTTHDWTRFCLQALEALLQAAGLSRADLGGLVAVEINRSQMDRSLAVCAALGLPLIDADHVGATAVPSLGLCRSVPAGVSLRTSYVVVQAADGALHSVDQGVSADVTGFAHAAALDARLRARSGAGGAGGVAAALFLGRDVGVLHPGSVSRTIALGAALDGADPVGALLRFTGGVRLGSGVLHQVLRHPGQGFTARTLKVGEFDVGDMNEFLSVERGGELLARVPGLIAVVDDEGQGVLTAQAERFLGRRLHLLELPLVEQPTADIGAEWDRIASLYHHWAQTSE